MSRTCEQSVTIHDRTTITELLVANKDKVHRDQTLGKNNKDAMIVRLYFVMLIYVTSVTKITFIMFLLKQSKFSAVISLFMPLVWSLLCVHYIRMLCRDAWPNFTYLEEREPTRRLISYPMFEWIPFKGLSTREMFDDQTSSSIVW